MLMMTYLQNNNDEKEIEVGSEEEEAWNPNMEDDDVRHLFFPVIVIIGSH